MRILDGGKSDIYFLLLGENREEEMFRPFPGALTLASLVACAPISQTPSSPNAAHLMGPSEFQSLPSTSADRHIAYGIDPNQFAELRIPGSAGPHPVAILIHGGCWKADYATLRDMAPIAEALKSDGVATWNIEYRRLPQPGSGWLGTFHDVGEAIDHLRLIADQYQLDLSRVVLVGHSAGGHLAMWAAARARLPLDSVVRVDNPLPVLGVVNLAGPGDMKAEIDLELDGCQSRVVEELLGGSPNKVPERFRQASPIALLPLGVPQVLIWGDQDTLRPISAGESYANAARAAGDPIKLIALRGIGHFEVASPYLPSWPMVRDSIEYLLKSKQ